MGPSSIPLTAAPAASASSIKHSPTRPPIGRAGQKATQIDGTDIKVNGTNLRQEGVHALGSPVRDRLLDQNLAFCESVDGTTDAVLWRKDATPTQLSLTVPSGRVFVLGDNRSTSQDSRHFGTLPLADVAGIVRQIWPQSH